MMRVPVLLAIVVTACISTLNVNAATTSTKASEELSYDGLQRRESKVFEHLWVRKYFDVRSYHKVIFLPPTVQYRPLLQAAQTDAKTLKASPLTKRQKDSLLEILNTAFRDELKKSQYFKLTDEIGRAHV